jgi:hypothetical protein
LTGYSKQHSVILDQESDMTIFARACTGAAHDVLVSFRAARKSMARSEFLLTALVVVALLVGAAVVSIAALAKQAGRGDTVAAVLVSSGAAVNPDVPDQRKPRIERPAPQRRE